MIRCIGSVTSLPFHSRPTEKKRPTNGHQELQGSYTCNNFLTQRYALTNPHNFNIRIGQVCPSNHPSVTLLVQHLRVFLIQFQQGKDKQCVYPSTYLKSLPFVMCRHIPCEKFYVRRHLSQPNSGQHCCCRKSAHHALYRP